MKRQIWFTLILGLAIGTSVIVGSAGLVPKLFERTTPSDVFAGASAALAALGFVGVAITIVVQGEQLRSTTRLATSTVLFDYYNNKISSLRDAIAAGRDVDSNKKLLSALLDKHGAMLGELEKEYRI